MQYTIKTQPKGTALIIVLVVVMLLAVIAASYITQIMVQGQQTDVDLNGTHAIYIAEGGVNIALNEIKNDLDLDGNGLVGNVSGEFGGGSVNVTSQDNNDGTWTVSGVGRFGAGRVGQAKRVEVILQRSSGGIYWYAVFAGNSSDDTTYSIPFAGDGDSADEIIGAVYSGNDIDVRDSGVIRDAIPADENFVPGQNASIDGDVLAKGRITDENEGIEGDKLNGEQPIPDLQSLNYEQKAEAAFNGTAFDGIGNWNEKYVDVASELEANGVMDSWSKGGTALQINDDSNPAHIFRKNATDRIGTDNSDGTVDTLGWQHTAKDDYYLEDPTVNSQSGLNAGNDTDSNYNGNNAYHINLTQSTDPTRDGDEKVYFVDGNLWVHNYYAYSMVLKHSEGGQAQGIHVTMVAKGNVYISDNLFYQNKEKDGVAIIAMKDEDVEAVAPGTTGNVFIGDPKFGTVRRINSFLYAENDFVDNNLSAEGSQEFTILGNMTAGNHVNIQRDWEIPGHYEWQRVRRRVNGRWRWVWEQVWVEEQTGHAKMEVYFDARIRDDESFRSKMVDIPLPTENDSSNFQIILYRHLPPQAGDLVTGY